MQTVERIKKTIKHWYAPLISGIIFIGAGILAFIFGKATFLTLTILFSLTFLLSGISEVIFSVANRKEMKHWGWSLAWGMISFIFGVALLAHPFESMFVLALLIGLAFLFRSIGGIIPAINLKNSHYSKWWFLLALSILGVLFSLVLMAHPLIAGAMAVIFTGIMIMLIVGGIFSICLSVLLKKLNKIIKQKDFAEMKADITSWLRGDFD